MILSQKEFEDYFDRGINYFRAGFYSSAIKEFRQLKKVAPNYPNIDFVLEACIKKNASLAGQLSHFIEENFDLEIRKLSEELVIENSSNLAAQVEALLKSGRVQEALNKLLTAANIVPDSRPLLLLTANVQRRLGMLAEAERTLLRAMRLYPHDQDVMNNLGNVYANMGLYKESEDLLLDALRLDPNNLGILNNLGSLKMQTYELDEAERLFKKVLKQNPDYQIVQRNLENIQLRINALEKEIEELREEFHKHPTYLDIGVALGKTLYLRGFFSEARSVFKRVLAKNSSLVTPLFYLGVLSEKNDNPEQAIEYYSDLVKKCKKTNSSEYLNYIRLMEQNFLEEALVELKKIAILELDLASSRINLGVQYFNDCLWSDALRHFEEAVKINDTYPDAYYWVAMAHVKLEQNNKAKQNLQKAIELNPRYADAHYQLGVLNYKKSKRKSIHHLSVALGLNIKEPYNRIATELLEEQK